MTFVIEILQYFLALDGITFEIFNFWSHFTIINYFIFFHEDLLFPSNQLTLENI